MVIDCHGHYTTAPKALQTYRDAQIAALNDAARARVKGTVAITDDEIRESLEGAQLKFQRERGMIRPLLSPHLEVRLVQNPVREIHRMASVMPQQVVDPRAWRSVHIEVFATEEICLDHHVVQVKGAVLDAAANLAVRRREAPRVRNHADGS